MTKFSKEIKYIDIAKINDKSNSEVLNKIIKVKIGKSIPYQMFDNSSSVLA
jgi:type III secretion system FlhB-like substrate exporter